MATSVFVHHSIKRHQSTRRSTSVSQHSKSSLLLVNSGSRSKRKSSTPEARMLQAQRPLEQQQQQQQQQRPLMKGNANIYAGMEADRVWLEMRKGFVAICVSLLTILMIIFLLPRSTVRNMSHASRDVKYLREVAHEWMATANQSYLHELNTARNVIRYIELELETMGVTKISRFDYDTVRKWGQKKNTTGEEEEEEHLSKSSLLAMIPGKHMKDEWVILGANADSPPSVAVLLNIARMLTTITIYNERTIVLAVWGDGYEGARHWCQRQSALVHSYVTAYIHLEHTSHNGMLNVRSTYDLMDAVAERAQYALGEGGNLTRVWAEEGVQGVTPIVPRNNIDAFLIDIPVGVVEFYSSPMTLTSFANSLSNEVLTDGMTLYAMDVLLDLVIDTRPPRNVTALCTYINRDLREIGRKVTDGRVRQRLARLMFEFEKLRNESAMLMNSIQRSSYLNISHTDSRLNCALRTFATSRNQHLLYGTEHTLPRLTKLAESVDERRLINAEREEILFEIASIRLAVRKARRCVRLYF